MFSPQDLFFKYTWNNFLHFQVELSIAAILSHSAQEGKTTTTDLESKEEVLNGNVATENSEPLDNSAENIMVTHVSLGASPGSSSWGNGLLGGRGFASVHLRIWLRNEHTAHLTQWACGRACIYVVKVHLNFGQKPC